VPTNLWRHASTKRHKKTRKCNASTEKYDVYEGTTFGLAWVSETIRLFQKFEGGTRRKWPVAWRGHWKRRKRRVDCHSRVERCDSNSQPRRPSADHRQISRPPATIHCTHAHVLDKYTAVTDKRVRSTSLYHARQCSIVLKSRSDHIDYKQATPPIFPIHFLQRGLSVV